MRAHLYEINSHDLLDEIYGYDALPDAAEAPKSQSAVNYVSETPDVFRAEPLTDKDGRYSAGQDWKIIVEHLVPSDTRAALRRAGFLPEPESQKSLGNNNLPIAEYKQEIQSSVRDNQVAILAAETGSGKSTQTPQMLLEIGMPSVLTQPRIMAARNVSDRIRQELTASRNALFAERSVAFKTGRIEDRRGNYDDAPCRIVTDGLLLAEFSSGKHDTYVHIIDEVHEANSNMEILMALERERLQANPDARLVIMSADVDAERIAKYFAPVTTTPPRVLNIPGRCFDVERIERPNSTAGFEAVSEISRLIRADAKPGANGIQVFVAGKREIKDTTDYIYRHLPVHMRKQVTVLPLHSKLMPDQQQRVMEEYPGVKVVISTEVGQTSLTIPDIVTVIDSGDHRQMELDDEISQGLFKRRVAQSGINQRAGRAGRVQAGKYILAPQSIKSALVPVSGRPRHETAEILRTDIVRHALRIIQMGADGSLGDNKTMADLRMLHQVSHESIAKAHEMLIKHDAIDTSLEITAHGTEMNRFPLSVPMARALLAAKNYSPQTQQQMAAIAASMEAGGLPYFAQDVGKRWTEFTTDTSSDMIAQLEIFIAAWNLTETEQFDYDLDVNNIERAQGTYRKLTHQLGLQDSAPEPPTEEECRNLRVCIGTGMITTLFKHTGDGWYRNMSDPGSPTLRTISRRSVVTGTPSWLVGNPYRLEITKGGESQVKHIIEYATGLMQPEVVLLAERQSCWATDGYTVRGGKVMERKQQILFGEPTGLVQEEAPQLSPALEAHMVKHMLDRPGKNLRQLRGLKKQIEQFDRLAKTPLERFTQDHLNGLLHEAVRSITSVDQADFQLGQLIKERYLTLEYFISAEQQADIIKNSPLSFTLGDDSYKVWYQNHKPIISVQESTLPQILKVLNSDTEFGDTSNPELPDGRAIQFYYGKKKYTGAQLLRQYY